MHIHIPDPCVCYLYPSCSDNSPQHSHWAVNDGAAKFLTQISNHSDRQTDAEHVPMQKLKATVT